MRTLFGDVIDLYCFRVKSLPAYHYPLWKIGLMLTAIGFVASAGAPELGGFLPGRIGFCIAYNWLETLLFTVFIGVWLQLIRYKQNRALLSLVVLSSGVQLLQPLLGWLPDDVAGIALLLLMLYSLVVLCYALVQVSGAPRLRVVMGVLLFSLLSGTLLQSSWYLASRTGWVDAPAGNWWNPLSNISGDAASTPASDANTSSQSPFSDPTERSKDSADDAPL